MAGFDVDDIVDKISLSSNLEEILQLRRQEGEIFTQNIEDITNKIRVTSDPKKLLKLRREEARIYGRIMMLDSPGQSSSIEAFNNKFLELCEAAYLLDSAVDLFKDYRNGVTAVKPTPSNYLVIGREAIRANYLSFSELPRRTIASLAVAAIKKAVRKTLKIQASQGR
jgi:hypothetical protein